MLLPTASCGAAAALLLSGVLGFDDPDAQLWAADGTVSSEELWAPGGTVASELSTREDSDIKSDIKSTFSVKQVKNENYRKKSGLMAMLDVYAKYSVPLPQELRTAMELQGVPSDRKRQQATGTTSSVSASPPQGYDYEFLVPVDIGTPPQTMQLNFDTGSSDLWVFSNDTNVTDVNGQTLYLPGASTTSALLKDYTFNINYGDGGSASGIVYTDVVRVGQTSIAGFAVESAIQVSSGFSGDPNSWGLVGLGQGIGNTVSPVKQPTFFESIINSLALPVFTANLFHGIPGTYDFGFINSSAYTGYIQYGTILPDAIYWEFAVTGYLIGPNQNMTNPHDGFTRQAWRSIADTGTTLLLLPDDITTAYYNNVPGSFYSEDIGGMVFPCSGANTLPDFRYQIGLYQGVLPGRYINYGNVDVTNTNCFGGIQNQGTVPFGIFGDVILKSQFLVFDERDQKIGFANKLLTT